MRTLILLLFASLASAAAQAQTLSTNLQKYKEICLDLRDAVNNQSKENVEKVKDLLVAFDRYQSHSAIANFHTEADYEGMEDFSGHILFEATFLNNVDKFWANEALSYTPLIVHRGTGGGVCTEQKVVAAQKTLTCTIPQCFGTCELVVIAERSDSITLSVTIDGQCEKVSQEDGVCEKIWTLPDGTKEDVHFSITNDSEVDFSCIIISN